MNRILKKTRWSPTSVLRDGFGFYKLVDSGIYNFWQPIPDNSGDWFMANARGYSRGNFHVHYHMVGTKYIVNNIKLHSSFLPTELEDIDIFLFEIKPLYLYIFQNELPPEMILAIKEGRNYAINNGPPGSCYTRRVDDANSFTIYFEINRHEYKVDKFQ